MLKTYLKMNKLNHVYMRYTGDASAVAAATSRILTEDSVNITTEGGDTLVTEDA